MANFVSRRATLAGLTALPFASACQGLQPKAYDADVIVIGAGLAGLYAAHLLAAESRDVLVLEASKRIGGRLYTIDHPEGLHTEAGGEEIGAGYARMRSTASALGVKIIANTASRPQMALHYKGALLTAQQWANAASNAQPERFKAIPPGSLLGALAYPNNPFKSPEDWRSMATGDVSAYDWLVQQGLPGAVISDIDLTLNGTDLTSYSMANLFRSLTLFAQDRQFGTPGSVEGGSQRLPEAIAAALPRAVLRQQQVKHIEVSDTSVVVATQQRTFKARTCVAALPFPVLANIAINAPLSPLQRTAMAQLPYTKILQIHFKANDAFWERDGLPPSMWTDGPLERIFASQNTAGEYSGLMRAWINGTQAQELDNKSDAAINELCKLEMRRLRPASKGDVDVRSIVRWTQSNALAGGAYMHWAPGQIAKWAGKMAAPAGRLYFAGEHLSYLHTGMEGAMESAETAAYAVLNA